MVESKLSKFDQIDLLVRDLEKTAKSCNTLLDFNGKINIVVQINTVFYKEKEATFKMKIIRQYFGGKQFEIIELLESTGDHLYSEFLKEGKERIHHLGIYTKKANELIEYFKNE